MKGLNFALAKLVKEMRAQIAEREESVDEERVVIKPLEEPGTQRRNGRNAQVREFEIEREDDGHGNFWFTVTGVKPERWVRQTNFDNDEAVGYLADRLAMQAERAAGHWADPSIDDDRHDEQSLFGRGEVEEYEDEPGADGSRQLD